MHRIDLKQLLPDSSRCSGAADILFKDEPDEEEDEEEEDDGDGDDDGDEGYSE